MLVKNNHHDVEQMEYELIIFVNEMIFNLYWRVN